MSGVRTEQAFLPGLFKAGILAGVYYAAGTLSWSLGLVSSAEILIWPPIGIGLAALLLYGLRLWPGIVLGAFLLSIRTGDCVLGALGAAMAITGESLLSAYLLQRWMRMHNSLARVRDVLALLGVAAVVSPATGCVAGALSCHLAGLYPWSEFGKVWLLWWRAEAMAIVTVAPAFLTWGSNFHFRYTWRKGIEASILATGLLLGNLLIFGRLSPIRIHRFPVASLPFALRLWAAFRFGPRGVSAANMLVVLIAARGTWAGIGPLAGEAPLQSLLFLGAYGISTSVVSLLVSAVINERQQVEEKLRASEEKFSKAFHSNPDTMGITTLEEGRFIDVNRAFERQFGYKREEVIGKTTLELGIWMDPADRSRLRAALQEHRSPQNVEYRFRTRSGQLRLMLFSAELIELGGERCMLAAGQDITDRKQAEEALREKTAYLNALIEGSPIAIVAYDSQGRIRMCNPAFERLFQYRQSEIIEANLDEIVAPGGLSPKAVGLTKRTLTGETAALTSPRRRKDGSLVDAEIIGVPLIVEGQMLGGYGLHQDITERKRLEEQLREAQKMEAIGRLAGGIAHDFNNLLVGILGYGSKLQEELAPDDPRHLSAKYIVQSGLRGRELIRQLLIFSRKHPIEARVLNLNNVLRQFEDTLQRLIGEDMELTLNLDPELRLMKIDPEGLTRVIMNLAANARDAMPNGGKLTIQTFNSNVIDPNPRQFGQMGPGPYVALSVSDTGQGMDEATQAHLFEPFFTTKPPGRGSGLGLASVLATVQLSSGHITVSSQLEQGTIFTLYFPCVCDPEQPITLARADTLSPRGSETILVVEDNPSVRNLVGEVLEDKGYTVLLASDGQEALLLAGEKDRGPIHLLLADIVMPGMSGRELAESLQKISPRTKVLYMTGYDNERLVPRRLSKKGIATLQKPFLPHELAGKVREVLDGRPIC